MLLLQDTDKNMDISKTSYRGSLTKSPRFECGNKKNVLTRTAERGNRSNQRWLHQLALKYSCNTSTVNYEDH